MRIFNQAGLYLIAGVKGVGKTSFTISILDELQEQYEKKHSIYCYTATNIEKLPDKTDRIKMIEVSELPIQTGHLFLEAEWTKCDHGLSAVIVDDFRYLLRTELFRDIELKKHEKILYILTRLKTLSEVYDVPVILTCEVDDDYIYGRSDKRPLVSDIPDHKYIKAFSDRIILMHRDEMFTAASEKKGITEFRVHYIPEEACRDYTYTYISEKERYCSIEIN